MGQLDNVQPPHPGESFDTVGGWEWASRITTFLQSISGQTNQSGIAYLARDADVHRARQRRSTAWLAVVRLDRSLTVVPGTAPGSATSIFFGERVETANPAVIENYWPIHGMAYISGTPNASSTILGGFFQGYTASGGGATTWGIATEAVTEQIATVSTTLVGGEFGVISQINTNVNALIGCYVVFQGQARLQATTVPNGIGANKYNNNSRAIQIASQGRSSAGEFCGWSSGIFFDVGSMDNVVGSVPAVLFDASRVPSSRAAVGIWVANDVVNRYSDTLNVGQVFRSGVGNMVWTGGGTDWFGINMTTGQLTWSTTTAGTATAGAVAIPALCAGFIDCIINGVEFKIPLFLP